MSLSLSVAEPATGTMIRFSACVTHCTRCSFSVGWSTRCQPLAVFLQTRSAPTTSNPQSCRKFPASFSLRPSTIQRLPPSSRSFLLSTVYTRQSGDFRRIAMVPHRRMRGTSSRLFARGATASSYGPRGKGLFVWPSRQYENSLFVWPFLIKLSQTLSCNGRGGIFFFPARRSSGPRPLPSSMPQTPQQGVQRSYHTISSASRPDLRVTL